MKFKDTLIDALKGFLIGTALLIPGVSAATIAFVTKVYDKLITNVSSLAKKFWPSFKALIPIGIGVAIAIVAMWVPLKLATQHVLFAIVCLFAGSMIGSLPEVTDNVRHQPLKKRYIIYLLLAILGGMSFGLLSYHCGLDVSSLFNPTIKWPVYLIIIPIGFLAAAGIVVPGISGSMMLLVLGFYTQILGMFGEGKAFGPALGVLVCMAIGVILGMICFSRLMKYLFSKVPTQTYIWLIGLVAGSIFSLFYNHDMMAYYEKGIAMWEWILGFVLLILAFVGSYALSLYGRKHAHR
ncbi:MAG: DUF368 domain-containing protein [Bacilli bacterium]|nr:DUF368 domain-containing protein [Bacilli bacterium]